MKTSLWLARALACVGQVEECKQQHDYTKENAVHNEKLERACLQIAQEKTDHEVADDGRNGDGNEQSGEGQVHRACAMRVNQFGHFFEAGAGDQRGGKGKRNARQFRASCAEKGRR